MFCGDLHEKKKPHKILQDMPILFLSTLSSVGRGGGGAFAPFSFGFSFFHLLSLE